MLHNYSSLYLNDYLFRWDMLTGDLELVESLDGHFDVLYGTYDPRHLTR